MGLFQLGELGKRRGGATPDASNHSRSSVTFDEEFQLSDSTITVPSEGVELSTWDQIKRLAVDTIFGRPITNPRVEGSASLMYSMGTSRRTARGRGRGAGPDESGSGSGMGSGMGSGTGSGTGFSRRQSKATLTRSFTIGNNERTMMRDMRRKTFEGKYIIDPEDGYHLLWQQLILLLSAYSAYITPFEFAFLPIPPAGLYWTDVAINFVFFADLVLTFFLAYKDKKTYTFVTDHKTIALRYLKSVFIFDFLALLPWSTLYQVAGASGGAEVFRWLLWTRCFRGRHVLYFFDRLEIDIRLSYFAVRITSLYLVEIYLIHLAGCFFYFLATTYPPDQEEYTWMGSLTLGNFSYANFTYIDVFTRYITSIYWATVTMATLGYGDIHATNNREMIFIMVYACFDLFFFSYLTASVTALVVKGSATTRYREKLSALVMFMNRKHLPARLRDQMKRHFLLQFETEQVDDEIMEEFPVTIRHKVSRVLYRRVVEECYLFNDCTAEFIDQIVARAVPEFYYPSEVIIQNRDSAEKMYIVSSGAVQEMPTATSASSVNVEDDFEHAVTLTQGCAFGEVALLCNIPQPFSVTVKELCQVLRIDKQVLNSIISMYITDGRQIVENLMGRTKEADSKFASLSSEICSLVDQQEVELTMTTIYAASRGEVDLLRQLIRAGASASKADYDGRAPLHLAAANGFDDVVTFLILEGADVNCRDNFGTTPLLEALRAGHDSTAKLLKDKGATVDLQEAGTDLCNAVIHNDLSLLQRLLSSGVDPNAADYDLRTPLHIAAAEGLTEIAEVLLSNGANVAPQDRWGNTPLIEARRCDCIPLIRLLKEAMTKQGMRVAESPAQSYASLPGLPPATSDSQPVGPSGPIPSPIPAPAAAPAAAAPAAAPPAAPAAPAASAAPAAPAAPAAAAAAAAASLPRNPSTDLASHPTPSSQQHTMWDITEVNSTGSSPAPSMSPLSFRPPGMPPRRSGGPRGMAGGGGGSGGGSLRSNLGQQQARKRVSVYTFPPWDPNQRVGRLMWLPPSIKELLEGVGKATESPGLAHVLTADGAEVTDVDLVMNMDKLYLVTSKELAEEP